MKILNLYAGIGGNRKLWGNEHQITAVELNKDIADVYQYHFPEDNVVVDDAIDYFEKHFHEFDFVWASPPCQSHTRINRFNVARRYNGEIKIKVKTPDMTLYSIINFLDTYFRGSWVVENTYSDYKPLKIPQRVGRHFIWSNKIISDFKSESFHNIEKHLKLDELCGLYGYDYDYFKKLIIKGIDKKQMLRNCVSPKLGKHILDCALK
jgi:DNA (cytosine-5)-methyltransferase 1